MFLTKGVLFDPCIFSDVKILAVDNDPDTGALYTALLESYGATVITTESIEAALNLLKQFIPSILICEARFLGERVDPLIQQVRSIAENSHMLIPIFVTSTFPAMNLAENLQIKIEAYQIKPIDLNQFVAEVWNLILLSKITQPLTMHDCPTRLNISKIACC
jgi:response regulator RpfG family c-di-GMP phosphodiesterase